MEENRKLQAAITGVMQFLKQEEDSNKQNQNQWVMAGRKLIMHNRIVVQRREEKW
jgi:hypothetical protein